MVDVIDFVLVVVLPLAVAGRGVGEERLAVVVLVVARDSITAFECVTGWFKCN